MEPQSVEPMAASPTDSAHAAAAPLAPASSPIPIPPPRPELQEPARPPAQMPAQLPSPPFPHTDWVEYLRQLGAKNSNSRGLGEREKHHLRRLDELQHLSEAERVATIKREECRDRQYDEAFAEQEREMSRQLKATSRQPQEVAENAKCEDVSEHFAETMDLN